MTQPVWPFSLVRPAGYVDGSIPSGAEIQLLQQQVAAAADGRVFTDVAAVKNYKYTRLSIPSPCSQRTLIRDPKSRHWLVFGGNTGNASWTIDGSLWPMNSGTGQLGAQIVQVTAAWANSQGVILAGGAPFSADTRKLRESTDGGATWATARNIGASDTNGVNAIVYSESLGLWLCSIGDHVSSFGVFTSVDRVTWTLRTGATAAPAHFIVRENPTQIILATQLQSGAGATAINYLRSVDGTTWTSETFPAGVGSAAGNTVCQGCWSDALGAFFVGGQDGIYTSTTGLTGSWTRIDTTWPGSGVTAFVTSSIAAFGRLLLRGDGRVSMDGGVTWIAVLEPTYFSTFQTIANDVFVIATPFGVGFCRGPSLDVWLSHQVGF